MTDKQKKLAILTGLLLLWLALILFRVGLSQGGRPRLGSALLPGERLSGKPAAKRVDEVRIPPLKLHLFEDPLPRYRDNPRNIFAPLAFPGPPMPKEAKGPAVPPPPPPPPDPFLDEPKKLRFLGFARAEGEVFAFLATGNEIIVAKEHEVIKESYLIKEVKEDYILLSTPTGDKEVKLSLSPK
ncbi:MAG: hypothetical protein HY998_06175 [candidate division NC10 bacterium]|nr:hypothetical protein [candidate division NC10 bacterium]